jgi:hypothetical protein
LILCSPSKKTHTVIIENKEKTGMKSVWKPNLLLRGTLVGKTKSVQAKPTKLIKNDIKFIRKAKFSFG